MEEKIVDFNKYCPKCKHWSKPENEKPCWDCLRISTNSWSHKPVYFTEKEER